jgi:hypothetical protein
MATVRRRLRDMGTANGWKRLCCEGHTVADATLTVAMAQIGQIMLGQCCRHHFILLPCLTRAHNIAIGSDQQSARNGSVWF